MNVVISAENEYLLRSIIEMEQWTECPNKKEFFQSLERIEQNCKESYRFIIEDLLLELKPYKFSAIQEYIDFLKREAIESWEVEGFEMER